MVDVFYCADILYAAVVPSGPCFVIFCDFELKSNEKKQQKSFIGYLCLLCQSEDFVNIESGKCMGGII